MQLSNDPHALGHFLIYVSTCVQEYNQRRPAHQMPKLCNEQVCKLLNSSDVNSQLAQAQQQAKADAKKAKKQRQKAKKMLTQAQAEANALAPCTSEAETTLPTQSSELGSSELLSSAAQGDSAAVNELHAGGAAAGVTGGITAEGTVGVTARVEEDEGASRKNEDAGMLVIFRCPLSQVSTVCSPTDVLLAMHLSVSSLNVTGPKCQAFGGLQDICWWHCAGYSQLDTES